MKVAIWSLAIPSLTIIPDVLQTFNMTYLPNPALLKHHALSQSVRVCKKNAPQPIFSMGIVWFAGKSVGIIRCILLPQLLY